MVGGGGCDGEFDRCKDCSMVQEGRGVNVRIVYLFGLSVK